MRTQPGGAGTPEANNVCGDGADNDGDTFIDDGCTLYLLKDHLGSTRRVLNSVGFTLSETDYWPFGGARNTPTITETDQLFTGQRAQPGDDMLGLYHYGARFYSTTLGLFLSVDPIGGAIGNPQSWNPYSYVLNNPLRFTDPTGMMQIGGGGGGGSPPPLPADNGESWAGSRDMETHRDTGCSWDCQQLRALAGVGWSYQQWQAWHQQQINAALVHIHAQNQAAAQWAAQQTIAAGGGSDCDTACQWTAAARAYESAAARAARESSGGGGGWFGKVKDVATNPVTLSIAASLALPIPAAASLSGLGIVTGVAGLAILGGVVGNLDDTPQNNIYVYRGGSGPEDATRLEVLSEIAVAVGLPHGVSVFDDRSKLPHRVVRRATLYQVAAAGFPLVKTGGPNHYTIVLPHPVSDEDAARFNALFSQGIP